MFEYFIWLYKKYILTPLNLVTTLISSRIKSEIEERTERKSSFNLYQDNKVAVISYSRFGKEYQLHTPYDPKMNLHMEKFRVYVVLSDAGSTDAIEITQQPGIPYLLPASEYGGVKYLVVNKETNATHFKKEKLGYLEEYESSLDD